MGSYVFANARIFDGRTKDLVSGKSVFVAAGHIAEVSDRPCAPADGEVIDCGGRTLMPGLIDAHVHAYAHNVNLLEVIQSPQTLSAAWAGWTLGRMLERGFTTVRDTGGADYGLFLALQRGWLRGPRLYHCGKILSETGGHGDLRHHHHEGAADHLLSCGCGTAGLMSVIVDGVDAVRHEVRENLRRGASFIKFTGSGGIATTGDKLESVQFSDEEVAAIIDEVERHGAYCTAHIHPDKALKRAVRLGVHCIEHGTLIEPDTARMAADRGTYIIPTLATFAALASEGEALGFPPESLTKLERVKDEAVGRLQYMKEAGVTIGFGSDLLGPTERHQLSEFTLRSGVFSAHELLVQATSTNADIIGAKGELGIIAQGAHADLLLVDGNPLADLGLLIADGAYLSMIMKGGEFIKRSVPSGSTPRQGRS